MKKLLMVLGLLAFAGVVEAQTGGCAGMGNQPVKPYAYEAITVSTTALGFTAATYQTGGNTPYMAVATLETASIRFRADGGVPTSSVGQLLTQASNVGLVVCGQSAIQQFKAIRSGASDGDLRVTYYTIGQ